MADLIIRPSEATVTGGGQLELVYEAQDFDVASTGNTVIALNIFFNGEEVQLGTEQADVNLESAELFAFNGDTTAGDIDNADNNEETDQSRTLLLTNVLTDFDGEQTLLTVPVNTTDQFDGSSVNFNTGEPPAGIEIPEIDGVTLEVNNAPIAEDDTGSTNEDTVLTVEAADGVLANDSDPDGDDLTVSAVNGEETNVDTEFELESGALLTLNADGSYDYDPNGAFDDLGGEETATDTFAYTVADGNGGTDTAEVSITVQGITNFSLDVDDNGEFDPLTDGTTIFRFLGELNPETFELGSNNGRNAAQVQEFLEEAGDLLDVDGNGELDPFTDGTTIFRFLGELNPETFALGDDPTRDATEVADFLDAFM